MAMATMSQVAPSPSMSAPAEGISSRAWPSGTTRAREDPTASPADASDNQHLPNTPANQDAATSNTTTTSSSLTKDNNNKAKQMPEEASSSSNGSASSTAKAMDGLGITGSNTAPPSPSPRQKPSTPSPSSSHSSPSLSTRRSDARADGMRQGDSSASAAAERKAVSMKRTSSGAHRSSPMEATVDEDAEADKTVVAGPSHQRSDTAQSSERAAVLSDAAAAAAASKRRRHRRRASRDSGSSGRDDESEEHDSPRSRTPSPILGRGFFLQSTPGRAGAPVSGPSAADIQSLLRGSEREGAENMYSSVEAAKPSSFQDVAEVQSLVDKVGKMQTSAHGDHIQELIESVQKLGQHAIAQDAYISSMEASMNNTRVTAVSVISNLTAAHAYEMNQERHLRDRLEVELEGAHASARKLSSLLARSKNRNEEFDRQRAASVEEEMKWAASLPGSGPRKPSAAAVAGANAAISPSMPQTGDREARAEPPATPSKANDGVAAVGLGLGLTNTPGGGSSGLNAEYTDVFDSPMSALVQERNKLVADKRYLRNRVRDAEAQLGRLENELKALRPLLVHGGARALAAGSTPSAPVTPASQRHYDAHAGMNTGGSGSATTPGRGRRDRSRRRRPTTLGDAEAEHLLLAARRLNNARAQQAQSGSVPPMLPDTHASPSKPSSARFADPTERPRTPPSRLPAQSSNTPQHFPPPKTPTSQLAASSKTPRSVGLSSASGKARALVSGVASEQQPSSSSLSSSSAAAAAAMGSPKPRPKPVLGHERMGSNGGAGMDELLHAAQSVLTPRDRAAAAQAQASAPNNYFPPAASAPMTGMPVTSHPDHRLSFYESPKRRRVSVADYNSPSGQQANRVLSASPQQRYISALHHKSSQNVLGGSRRTRTVTEGADATGIASPVSYQRGATHGTGSASGDRSGSGGEGRRSDGDDAGSTGLSALDLLADQAAASQNPSQSSEPSDSDHERHRNGFSSQEEGPDHDGGHHRRGSRVSAAGGPRSAASSLIAARARASAAAPIAYSQSVAPHMDYPSTPPLPPTPTRFQYSGNGAGGLPPPPPPPPFGAPLASLPGMSPSHRNSGAGGMGADNNSVLGSPISSGHHHHHRYSSSGGGSGPLFDPYGHRGSAGSYLGGLPPINTSLPPPPPPPPHGMHGMGPSHAHYPAPPPSPPLSAPPHHHHGGHSHHRSLSGLNGSVGGVNGSGQMAGAGAAPGFMGSASPSASPVSATKSSKHQRSSASIDMGGTPAQTPRSSAKHGGSSSATANASMANHSSSNSAAAAAAAAAAKQKGGNTSPDKRLPYVRWTAEEDSKLRRAIGQHGQRWEAVAKAVGTRSYHQCRQRALLMRRKGVDPAGGGGGGGTDGGGGSSSAGERGLADGDDDGGDEGDGYD